MVIFDTPNVAFFIALTHYVYSDLSLHTMVGVCFPLWSNICIQTGSTMSHCDDLLTIILLPLVNRFVHGHSPMAVTAGKGLASLLSRVLCFCYFPIWCYKSGMVLDCINS